MSIEDMNYYSDARVRASEDRWWDEIRGMEARVADDYSESGTWIPFRYDVCPLCEGRGKHVNPSVDSNGLTREDFDEDPDFAESYFRGDYDVPCNLCHGQRVVPVPTTARGRELIEEIARQRYLAWREDYAERMVGA